MEVKFRWSESAEEGRISKADRKRLLEVHWLLAADFLTDVLAEAAEVYNEVLEKRNV